MTQDSTYPKWEVQQAFPIEKYPVQNGTTFWLTQKLNGVRATFYNGQLIARSGAVYNGLDHIISELSAIGGSDLVFDGELTLKDTSGFSDNEAFRIATGIINSDREDKHEIVYTIFDVIPLEDFTSGSPMMKYSSRRDLLGLLPSSDSVRVLPVLYSGDDITMIDTLLERIVAEGKEGLVLNLDVPYRRTRHSGILKVKRFYTMDLPIIGCEEGSGRLSGALGALIVQYKDNLVRVGTGFTDEQRAEFWSSREHLNGILCEVKYKEISKNKKTGLESLQFPVFVSLRHDKNDVSFG